MISKKRIPWVVFVLSIGLTLGACTDKEEAAEETVETVETEAPATPPEDGSGSMDGVGQTIYFAFDDYTLDSESQESLNNLADYLKANAGAVVQISGHCDERGSIEYNLALGERRAQSVKNYLSQLGVEADRLPTISYGEEKPSVEGHDESAWSRNRRAEFELSNP